MNEKEAEQLSILFIQLTAKLNQSVAFIKDKDSAENYEQYRSAVAKVMGSVLSDLKEPLWERFPNLKPTFLGGSYKVSPEIQEQKFYELQDENS